MVTTLGIRLKPGNHLMYRFAAMLPFTEDEEVLTLACTRFFFAEGSVRVVILQRYEVNMSVHFDFTEYICG